MSREHNDANLLVLGGRVLGSEVALDMVGIWLDTAFGGDRHQRRLDLIEKPPQP
jgi:ribose 5-phosphate isomerase B